MDNIITFLFLVMFFGVGAMFGISYKKDQEKIRICSECQIADLVEQRIKEMQIDIQLESKNGECLLMPIINFKGE
jgi:hypothetical protein